jgi:hypothetical protein
VAISLGYAEARLVFAEDEEQVDKLLNVAELPTLQAHRLCRPARHAEIRRPAAAERSSS